MTAPLILPVADSPRTLWRNGAGETRVLLEWPQASWLLRVSVATIPAGASEFSLFPGVDRFIAVLSGGRVRLTTDAAPAVELHEGMRSMHAFAGDARTSAHAEPPGCQDLNIMGRRGAVRVRTVWASGSLRTYASGAGAFFKTAGRLSYHGGASLAVPAMALVWWPNPSGEHRTLEWLTPAAAGFWLEVEQLAG